MGLKLVDDDGQPVDLVHWHGEEWSALYVNGSLVSYGDTYHQDEWLLKAVGGRHESGGEFLGGTNSQCYATLDECYEYRRLREQAQDRARELRAQAAQLIADAEQL